jgi:hypothetical protein
MEDDQVISSVIPMQSYNIRNLDVVPMSQTHLKPVRKSEELKYKQYRINLIWLLNYYLFTFVFLLLICNRSAKNRRFYLWKKASKMLSRLQGYLTTAYENSKIDEENQKHLKRSKEDDIVAENESTFKRLKRLNNNDMGSSETLNHTSSLLNVFKKVNSNYIEKLVSSFLNECAKDVILIDYFEIT